MYEEKMFFATGHVFIFQISYGRNVCYKAYNNGHIIEIQCTSC